MPDGKMARVLVPLVPGWAHSLTGHVSLYSKEKTALKTRVVHKMAQTATDTLPILVTLCSAIMYKPGIWDAYLLGSIGAPQPAQKKFWATTPISLLRTENGSHYIPEATK